MSVWKQNFTLEGLNALCNGNMGEHLGIHFFALGPDCVWAKMPVDERTRQPMGILHGGASVALAETMGSIASTLCMENLNEYTAVGIEINASHLKSVRSGSYVIGKVSPIRIGRTLQVWKILISNSKGQKVCIVRLTTMMIKIR